MKFQRYAFAPNVPKHLQTQEELVPLILAAQGGDRAAMNELAYRVAPLVYHMGIRKGRGISGEGRNWTTEHREEILQECWAGFAEAVERYDPDHPSQLKFWTVASYRMTGTVRDWMAKNSGAMALPTKAWKQAHKADKALEAAGVTDWEGLSDADLRTLTGIFSAGPILRGRRNKAGPLHDEEGGLDDGIERLAASAEDEYMDAYEDTQGAVLWDWLQAQRHLEPAALEEALYWQLEALGLAGEVSTADVLKEARKLMKETEQQ